MQKRYIFHCLCYTPKVYSGLDKFTLMLANKLAGDHFQNIFLFYDTLDYAPVYRRALEEDGHTVVLLDSHSGTFHLLKAYFKCFRLYRPAIVHVHFTSLFKLFNSILRLFYSFKLFISFHSTVNPYPSYRSYRRHKGWGKAFLYTLYCRFLYRQSEAVICVSRAVEQQLLQFLRQKEKVRCIYLGVDPVTAGRASALAKLGLKEGPTFRICHISAFEQLKGIDIILKAVRLLLEKYRMTDFQIYLIGTDRREDHYSESMRQLASELQIEEHIVWLGKRFDIQDILPAFDVYIQPSRFEGLPVALMEASAAGLPLIGTRIGGIPEIILHESNGFLIDNQSAGQLASCLNELARNKAFRRQMAIRSKERWEELFDIEKQTQELYQLYTTT